MICTADVYPYNTSIKPVENVTIVSAKKAYNHIVMITYNIIVLNECMYYVKRIYHGLINTNNVINYGI